MAELLRNLSFASVFCLTLFHLNNHFCKALPHHDTALTVTPPALRGCLLPPSPQHGEYISPLCKRGNTSAECGNVPGSLVPSGWLLKYSCHQHYALSSEDSKHSVCDDGVWDNQLDCIKLCPPLSSSSLDILCRYHGEEVDCARPMRPNSTAKFQCKPHYSYMKCQRPEYSMLLCRPDGKWNNDLLECSPDCGVPNTNIKPVIGDGEIAVQSDFPWLAVLYRLNEFNLWSPVCSGTLISPRLVLTAAHCVTTYQGRLIDSKNFTIGLGKYFRDYYKNESHALFIGVEKIVVPHRYTGSISYYAKDIALIALKYSVQVTSNIMPACVDWQRLFVFNNALSNTIGHVATWGVSKEGAKSDYVLPTTLKNVDQTDCIRSVEYVFQRFILVDKFCATITSSSTGGLVDRGASGAGMTLVGNNLHYIVGIVSTRINSEKPFALFTDLNEHLVWLESQKNLLELLYTAKHKTQHLWNSDNIQMFIHGWGRGDSGGVLSIMKLGSSDQTYCVWEIEIVNQTLILIEKFCTAVDYSITGYKKSDKLWNVNAKPAPEIERNDDMIQPTISGKIKHGTKNATRLCAEDMGKGKDISWGFGGRPMQPRLKELYTEYRQSIILPITTTTMW